MNEYFADKPSCSPEEDHIWKTIYEVLEAARRFLNMDTTFLGQFYGDKEFYRSIVGDGSSFGLEENLSSPRDGTYCQAMIQGHIDLWFPIQLVTLF